jgi:hypothetical protein
MADDSQEKRDPLRAADADGNAIDRSMGASGRCTPAALGTSYEDAVHESVERIAAGLGDQYSRTGTTSGRISRCKKGDGVLTVLGQPGLAEPARVVVEMTLEGSGHRDWVAYLEEAERNRGAQASLGVVPSIAQVPSGEPILTFPPNRMVMAFDADRDDLCVLRAALLLLRCQAITAASRRGAARTDAAAEKLAEAIELVAKFSTTYKTATLVLNRVGTMATEMDSLRSRIYRLLTDVAHDLKEAGGAPEGSP